MNNLKFDRKSTATVLYILKMEKFQIETVENVEYEMCVPNVNICVCVCGDI